MPHPADPQTVRVYLYRAEDSEAKWTMAELYDKLSDLFHSAPPDATIMIAAYDPAEFDQPPIANLCVWYERLETNEEAATRLQLKQEQTDRHQQYMIRNAIATLARFGVTKL